MVKIKVFLPLGASKATKNIEEDVESEVALTLGELIEKLKAKYSDFEVVINPMTDNLQTVTLVNGVRTTDLNTKLNDLDKIVFYPAMSGG